MICCNNGCNLAEETLAAAAASSANISLIERDIALAACSTARGGDSTPQGPQQRRDNDTRYCPLLADMPTLPHWPDRNQPFDYANSQVIAYICGRFGIGMDLAIRVFAYASAKRAIRFHRDTGLWCGVKGDSQ
jgi:hypothetical protein